MKKLVLALALASGPAFAQQQPFVPFTINEQTYSNFMSFLSDKPYYIAKPIIDSLQQMENQAQMDAREAARKSKEEKKEEEPK